MQSLYEIHGFGRKSKKRCRTCKRKVKSSKKSKHSKHKHSKKNRHSHRLFGNSTTPGTTQWKQDASGRNKISKYMNKYANAGKLIPAKGWTLPSSLYMNSSSSTIPNVIGMPNEPAQFSNNQLNSPVFLFGTKKKKHKTYCIPSLSKSIRPRKFGPLVPNVAGPNTVGYQDSIPLYHAGANTIDFATNKLFRPNIVGSIGKVQPDGLTPNAWLTQSVGVGDGLGKKYRFGNTEIYTPNGVTYGTGHNTIMQPLPTYLKFGKDGKKGKKRGFGGSVITLNGTGKIQISKPV